MKSINVNLVPKTEVQKFNDYLLQDGNSDLIFSAPFGSGKTFFLANTFRHNEEAVKEFNFIHLYPVNYSIASNDDIFDLIKYDILIELLKDHREYIEQEKDLNFSELLTAQGYLMNNFEPFSFLKDILHKSELLGKPIFEVFDLFKKEYQKYVKYSKELNTSEENHIFHYLEKLSEKIKIKELDPISELINKINVRIKESSKKCVLIIDDLDRIDPEHIFRIINVFSAHRDYISKSHKFGFDRIILVCDIDNIRKIYEHKYGKEVDFNGYISKFLSKEVYYYNIREYLNNFLDESFGSLKYNTNINGLFERSPYHANLNFSKNTYHGDNYIYYIFKFYLNYFIDIGKVNIRDLSKLEFLEIPNLRFNSRTAQEFNAINFPILIMVKYMDTILGGKRRFYNDIIYQNKNFEHLSFQTSPSLFSNPKRILKYILEEILTINILPNDDIENEYRIKLNRNDIPNNLIIKEEDLFIKLSYNATHDWDRKVYRINIDDNKLDWTILAVYNINSFLESTLKSFYKNNPTF